MADEHTVSDNTENVDDVILEEFDEATDKELEEAGDDPTKLKEIIKIRTNSRQKLYARLKEREAKDAVKPKEDIKQPVKGNKATELDYGQKAYLVANGIKGADEFSIIQEVMETTGKSLDEVMELRYVKSELEALRQEKLTMDAMPKDKSIRGGQSARNTVEYWIAKGELPPADQVKLRREVVHEKIRRDTTANKFGGN